MQDVGDSVEGTEGLLARHLPVLRFDTRERYFADAVEIWAENPACELRRRDGPPVSELRTHFLGPQRYRDGSPADSADRIADTRRDYYDQYRAFSAVPRLRDRAYGHAAVGSDGRTWLAYWFFSFYNDFRLWPTRLGAGRHEGDWEMIQLRLDPAGEVPDLGVYVQHQRVVARPWEKIERVGEGPVVYVGCGSHACYFTPGMHWTGAWFERADGAGHAPELTLTVIRDGEPSSAWALWPGRWGGTQPRSALRRRLGDAVSPRGPGHQRQWRDPAKLLEGATHRPRGL